MKSLLALAPLALATTLSAPGCTASTDAPSFAAVICDLPGCVDELDGPVAVAVGGEVWLAVSAPPGEQYRVRASDPGRLAVSVDVAWGRVGIEALGAGDVDLELIDRRGDVVDVVALTLVEPDRLVARVRWVEDGATQVREPVVGDAPLAVPRNAAAYVAVAPFAGTEPLAGLIDYEITASLPDGARLHTDSLWEVIVAMRTGEHALTFRTGTLAQRFVLTTP
jgi:hypothetical protein